MASRPLLLPLPSPLPLTSVRAPPRVSTCPSPSPPHIVEGPSSRVDGLVRLARRAHADEPFFEDEERLLPGGPGDRDIDDGGVQFRVNDVGVDIMYEGGGERHLFRRP